jgi:hypothetical protein
MGEQDDPRTGLPRRLRDQSMTGPTGGSGQAGCRFGAGPVQATPFRPDLAGGAFGEGRPGGGVRAEPVIDREGQQASAVLTRPVGGEAQQGDGVATAGQGEGQRAVDSGLQARRECGPRGPGPVDQL